MKLGTSFTEFTVSTNVSVPVSEPSLTVTVMVAAPFWFASGVTVTVRFAPLPPNTMLALGTSAVFDDEPLTVRLPAAVCASLTVNATAPVASSLMVRSAMSEIVGGVFDGVTVSVPAA